VSRGRATVAAAILLVAAAAGCGFGPGESDAGEATLTVTRDYGSERLLEATRDDPLSSETVMRFLDSEAEITTRYGGGFVHSIEGLAGGSEAGRRYDWFFFVNGIESSLGAAEVDVRAGDRIWWDYRDWSSAMRVPAVVGSFPQPLVEGGARVECRTTRSLCGEVRERLPEERANPNKLVHVIVGAWPRLRRTPVVEEIDDGPAASGVFADFARAERGFELVALDETASEVRRLGAGAGLIAAVRGEDGPPTWVLTGSDAAGVERAAEQLDESRLRDRYALAVERSGEPVALPVVE
jgi:hypothetical protein